MLYVCHLMITERTQAICGNHRIDPGEKCDAGLLGCMNMDDCCHDNCTLKTGAVCRYNKANCSGS